jgi:hypothetical protein
MALKNFLLIPAGIVLLSCNSSEPGKEKESGIAEQGDSAERAIAQAINSAPAQDTVFTAALPPVFDGDIIMINSRSPQGELLQQLAGGKYNHVGIIFQRKKDGILMVLDVQDSVRATPLTDFTASSVNGAVCLLRLKDANKTLTESKMKSMRETARFYAGKPFDPVLNWDDSRMYSSELVWKVYDKSMMLKLCPTRTVSDFDISDSKKQELTKTYGGNVSEKDEAVGPDDIYNSNKLEVIYEK